jgi:hypothetical protein
VRRFSATLTGALKSTLGAFVVHNRRDSNTLNKLARDCGMGQQLQAWLVWLAVIGNSVHLACTGCFLRFRHFAIRCSLVDISSQAVCRSAS